jgi:enoyl-CoA hydratase/carnithine racemase
VTPVAVHQADAVAWITLDDPERRNVLSIAALDGLAAALDAAADDAVRAVVLTGTGPAFCAGADLRAAGTSSWADGPARYAAVLQQLLDHPKPTVARVQGHVAAGGNGLVAACDLAVAVATARFAFTEVRVGAVPAVVAVAALPLLAPRDAAELLLLGERVTAERACRAGLLTQVAADEIELDAVVASWLAALRLGAPGALATTKEVLRRVPRLDRPAAFAWAQEISAAAFSSAEAAEGMAAFTERRPPAWAGD